MEIIIPRCAGLDVHKKTVMACVRLQGPSGSVTQQIRTFGTTTRELTALRAWLQTCAVTHVAIELLGVSGRAMLHALVTGDTDPCRVADLAPGRLRAKIPALQEALQGSMTDHHRFVLHQLLEQVTFLERHIAQYDQRVAEATAPFAPLLARLDTIPGINRRTAENLIAEIGVNMAQFPTAAQLASWAGICPGQNESAGRSRGATIRKGNRWLRRTLGQAAWAARNSKRSYPAAQFRHVAARRGRKRAIVAVAHSLLIAAYYVLRDDVVYHDLGPDHFERLRPEALTRMLVKRLERLGHKVSLEAVA